PRADVVPAQAEAGFLPQRECGAEVRPVAGDVRDPPARERTLMARIDVGLRTVRVDVGEVAEERRLADAGGGSQLHTLGLHLPDALELFEDDKARMVRRTRERSRGGVEYAGREQAQVPHADEVFEPRVISRELQGRGVVPLPTRGDLEAPGAFRKEIGVGEISLLRCELLEVGGILE